MIIDIYKEKESERVDLKEEYGFLTNTDEQIQGIHLKNYIDGQWDEFARDYISLSNGGISEDTNPGFLIIGVREVRNGNNIVVGAKVSMPSKEQILGRLKERVLPSISDFSLDQQEIDGSLYYVIKIPYSETILYSSKEYNIYSIVLENGKKTVKLKKHYSKNVVYYRISDTVDIASPPLVEYIKYLKYQEGVEKVHNIVYELKTGLNALVSSSSGSAEELLPRIQPHTGPHLINGSKNIEIEAGTASDLVIYIMNLAEYTRVANYDETLSILKDRKLKKFLQAKYANLELLISRLNELKHAYSILGLNKINFTEKNAEMLTLLMHKDRQDIVRLPSLNFLNSTSALVQMHDIITISVGILGYFEKNFQYMIDNPPRKWLWDSANSATNPPLQKFSQLLIAA